MAKTKRGKSELRSLAQKAKMRLKMGFWEQVKRERSDAIIEADDKGISEQTVNDYFRHKITTDINKTQNKSGGDEELYKKVCKLLDDDEDIINPIGRLIDREKYDQMDSNSKQRYIMMLAAKYQELSERYYSEKKRKLY